MKAKTQAIISKDNIIMRSIDFNDIEYLRIWKNSNKEFFFSKKDISPEKQLQWFHQMLENDYDIMFIIEKCEKKIGCIGARLYDNYVDVYNVILGDKSFKGKHIMTKSIEGTIAFCDLVFKDLPIRVRVLKNNPAIQWYQKIGFVIINYFEDYILMEFEKKSLKSKYNFNIDIELPF